MFKIKGPKIVLLKGSKNYIVQPNRIERRNELETKAELELAETRSNKRNFGSCRRGDSGRISVEGLSNCIDVG